MTFNTNVPNAGQSPGLFPAQNNTNFIRLKTIIGADHVFNDTAQATDGIHNQVTLLNRADPTGALPAGNSVLYGKAATDAINEAWFYDGTTARQLNWRELTGNVTVGSSFTTVTAVPNNCYGYIYLFKAKVIQAGAFVSSGNVVNGFAYAEKYQSGSGAAQILEFGVGGGGGGESGLNLVVQTNIATVGGVSTAGTWQYHLFYRLYTP